jgi:hypothetical protein
MVNADATTAGLLSSVVANADQPPRRTIEASVEPIQKVRLAVLEIAPNRIRAEVSRLSTKSGVSTRRLTWLYVVPRV